MISPAGDIDVIKTHINGMKNSIPKKMSKQ